MEESMHVGEQEASLQDQSYHTIRRKIVYLDYKPGEKLGVKQLCDDLDMGRTPVREALVRLAQEGLVRTVPQSGTYVSPINLTLAESACYIREHLEKQVIVECCARATSAGIEQLDRAISLSLYPDAGGSRGVGYSRANMYGRDFDPYRVDVAKDILLVAQIEHIRAVDQLDAILSHPRLDAIMVGPYDLSGSMGLTGQFDHPDFVAVMARINEACTRHNMPMGNHVVQPEPERLAKCIADGYRFIAYGIDAVFLLHGCACPKR